MSRSEVPLEPGKVFQKLTETIAATRTRFEDYSSGVSKLLRFKDDILSKAAERKPLTSQQLTNLAVISSSLFLSKTAVEEQLKGIDDDANRSLHQAQALPTRAMLLWGQIAMKLLRRLYISENVQMRYRTARMLEIWDLAAASLPPSPEESPRLGKLRGRGRGRLVGMTQDTAPVQSMPAYDYGAAADLSQPSAVNPGQMNAISNGVHPDFSPSAAVPTPSRMQPDGMTLSRSASQRQKQPSPTSAAGQYARQASGQIRDMALLQVSSAQLSRSNSHASASPRPAADAAAANVGSGLTAEPTLANFANTHELDNSLMKHDGMQQSPPKVGGFAGLLAAVDAAVGGFGQVASTNDDIVAQQNAATDFTSILNDTQDLLGASANAQSSEQQPGTTAGSSPGLFFSMPAAIPTRTRSNLRTSSNVVSVLSTDGTLPALGGNQAAAGQVPLQQPGIILPQQLGSLPTGTSPNSAVLEEVDWQA